MMTLDLNFIALGYFAFVALALGVVALLVFGIGRRKNKQ